ncbi:hypothetical protein N7527_010546 [Penicillium freii]|nr:hypothetical protein N7527_010546 [Penicillium freii]
MSSDVYTNLNPIQKLHVVREGPQTILPKLWEHWEGWCRGDCQDGPDSVGHPDEVARKDNGQPTMSITKLEKAAVKINNGNPEKPLDPPKSIPDPWDEELSNETDSIDSQPDLNAEHRTKKDKQSADFIGPTRVFALPWQDIGIDLCRATNPHRGGEQEALRILGQCIKNEDYIGRFEKLNTSPADFKPQSTTLVSPHLHFGSLSVRKFWWDVQGALEKKQKAKKPV